jgi:glutamyl-tRNA synthetase
MILGADGEKLSKRHGAVSVMQYEQDGYLPEALVNYLARLGWSHGDEEVFSRDRLVEWFDLAHVSRSPAQFNPEKLAWLNQQYLKTADPGRLARGVEQRLVSRGLAPEADRLEAAASLYRDRVSTLNELADALEPFFMDPEPDSSLLARHLSEAARPALQELRAGFAQVRWERSVLNALVKEVLARHGLKLAQVAIPLRVILTGQTQTPSIDLLLEAYGREATLRRLDRHL